MPASVLPDQKLVAHVFAPVDGQARQAVDVLRARCRAELDLSVAVSGDETRSPGGNYRLSVRAEGDIVRASLTFAVAPVRRVRIGSSSPAGWAEFARWWSQLTTDTPAGMLGTALVFRAGQPPSSSDRDAWGAEAWAALPPADDDSPDWWRRPSEIAPGAWAWEVTAGPDTARRRLVVLGTCDDDVLGRCLTHAARLRLTSRAGRDIPDQDPIAGTRDALLHLRDLVDGADRGMRALVRSPMPGDVELHRLLSERLRRDLARSETGTALASPATYSPDRPSASPPGAGTTYSPDRLVASPAGPGFGGFGASADVGEAVASPTGIAEPAEARMGFGVDVVGYRERPDALKIEAQERVGGLIESVLGDLGLRLDETDRQDAGDGLAVVLPAKVALNRALPRLLLGWRNRLGADNESHRDRLRLRLSVSVGPFARTALGFSGGTIVEIGRMLDSGPLRRAMTGRPDLDLAALVSERLYRDVAGPDLSPEQFESLQVRIGETRRSVWLWTGGEPDGLPTGLVREARELVGRVLGWQLAELRWQLVDRTLQVALDAVEASDEDALGSAIGELELLGPVRQGRVGSGPTLPCPKPIHARVQRLAGFLHAGKS